MTSADIKEQIEQKITQILSLLVKGKKTVN
jgi:hypothetical protein